MLTKLFGNRTAARKVTAAMKLEVMLSQTRFSEYQHDARNKNDESQQQKRQ